MQPTNNSSTKFLQDFHVYRTHKLPSLLLTEPSTTYHRLPSLLLFLFMTRRYYTPTGGNIVFAGADMPVAPAAWGVLESVTGSQLCNTTLTLPAYSTGHICSYLCVTSGSVDVSNNLCWIVPNAQVPAGSSRCIISYGTA